MRRYRFVASRRRFTYSQSRFVIPDGGMGALPNGNMPPHMATRMVVFTCLASLPCDDTAYAQGASARSRADIPGALTCKILDSVPTSTTVEREMDGEGSVDPTLGARLVEALHRDPVAGWQAVIKALPQFGLSAEEQRMLAREIRDLIRLRRAWQRRCAKHL